MLEHMVETQVKPSLEETTLDPNPSTTESSPNSVISLRSGDLEQVTAPFWPYFPPLYKS